MSETITFTIDGKTCTSEKGKMLTIAARENGVYIPVLCDYNGLAPAATCRVCTVKVQGAPVTACTTPVREGMEVECDTEELNNMRKAIIEMLFVEGNHFCPACEKSGSCELQALAYRFLMMAPRYPYSFVQKQLDATSPKVFIEPNRCVLCKRCVHGIKTADGKSVFAFKKKGYNTDIQIDHALAATLTDKQAQAAMDICPVGAILKKEKGFDVPIGKRMYDKTPIGTIK